MKQTFYLFVLSVAFLTAALISDVPDCFSAQPRQSLSRPTENNDNKGGRVVRRVTTNTHTGKVIKDEQFAPTSPIHQTYQPGFYNNPTLFPDPGNVPSVHSGNKTTTTTPQKPRMPPRMPRSSSNFPGLPAYPPAPPGFPPPPDFWPSFLYYGLPVLLKVRVSSIPDYPSIQQLGVYAVFDGYGARSGSILIYYNRLNSRLGGYFNPVGTKYTRSVQGLVSDINGVQTANFIVNDQFKTECTVQFSDLFGTSAAGTMFIPSRIKGFSPQVETFTLQRLK